VNCRRVQELLAPYVDERLTGQEMLEVRRHLDGCRNCTQEYIIQRQAKVLLRSVAMKKPDPLFETRLQAQIAAERNASVLALQMPAFNLTNRGRRFAYAVALSCVSILSLAHATSTTTNLSDAQIRPSVDAQMPSAILTDLQGGSIANDLRIPSGSPMQSGFFQLRRPNVSQRYYNSIGGFSSPVSAFPAASVSFAAYPTH